MVETKKIELKNIWGQATSFITRYQKLWWVDIALLLGLIGLVFGILSVSAEWTGVHTTKVEIDLSPWAFPSTPSSPFAAA